MNNIQKSFKNKAKCGLRMADGGLLDSFNKRQAEWGANANAGGGFATMPDTPSVAAGMAEGQRNFDAGMGRQSNPAQGMLDSIVSNSNLSGRQKAQAAMGLNGGSAGALDTSGIRGLSARQGMQLSVDQFRADQKPVGYADGGVVVTTETADQLMARMSAKYGAPSAGPAKPVAQPAPQPAPAPVQAQPAPQGLRGYAAGMGIEARMKAAGLAEGGIVKGKGGPTDDEVPMRVNGKDVNLSNTEAVLPAKTVDALGGPEAVEELIEKTNGKPPVKSGLRAGGEYADGWSLGKSSAFSNDAGLDVKGKAASLLPDPNRPTDPSTDGRRVYSAETAPAFVASPQVVQRTAHNVIMNTPTENTKFDLPITTADKSAGLRAAHVAEDSLAPDIKGLRAAGVTGPVQGDVTVNGKTGATGIRTIDGANGQKIYAGRDAKGQLNVSSGAGLSAAESDAASDARFAAAGTKKDAYGNWMSPQRLGDQAALEKIQKERTLRDAFDQSITDPGVQANARASLGYDLAGKQIAAKGSTDAARLALEAMRFDREGKQQEREQGNKDRDFKFRDDEAHIKRVDDLVKSWATADDGKLDNKRYSQLQKYASQFKRGNGASSDQHLRELMDNFAVDDLFEKQGRHWSSPEGVSSGEAVERPSLRQAGASALLDGRLPGQASYRDPLTQRVIYQSDVVNQLSPAQQKILAERLAKQ